MQSPPAARVDVGTSGVSTRRIPARTLGAVGTSPSPFEVLRSWQSWLEVTGRANANTRRQYRRYVLGFLADSMLDPLEVTEDDLIAWAAGVDRHGDMFGMSLRALKSFYRYAADRGLVQVDPTGHMRTRRHKYLPPAETPDPDLERVFAAAEAIDPRARPTLELIFATGARLGSICAVRSEDIDLAHRLIRFCVAKYDDPYEVPLGERGLRAARELLALADYRPTRVVVRRPTLVGVGPSRLSQWVKLAGDLAGVQMWTHRLRHEFAHRVANDPRIPALVAAQLLNHRDPTMLRVYARGRDPLARLAVEGL